MSAIEEHKPAEKRRALGRGLDSLLPSGPRVVAAAPAVMPPPVVVPGEIEELHGTPEDRKSPPKQSLNGAPSRVRPWHRARIRDFLRLPELATRSLPSTLILRLRLHPELFSRTAAAHLDRKRFRPCLHSRGLLQTVV